MSDTPPDNRPKNDDEIDRERVLAAEYSLGLLEGEELLAARGRVATDPDFAWRKDWWDDWFVPLSDKVGGAEPGERVWQGIEMEVGRLIDEAPVSKEAYMLALSNMAEARQRLSRWKNIAGFASAAAAIAIALLFTVGTQPRVQGDDGPVVAINEAPLMASIPIADTPLRLGITVLPASDEMLVSAAGLTADGVHDHELWLVPSNGGELQSLGVVVPGEERRVALPEAVRANIEDGVQLLLTREPLGGKPEGQNAGPVVAEGTLTQV